MVNADATVMMSLKKSRANAAAGKDFGCTTPKCLMQALSLSIPQKVLQVKVMIRFWIGIGRFGIMAEWSVRLLTVQVMKQTKYIHLNLQEVKKSAGAVNNRVSPLLTPSITVCFPLAYSMTERSKMALEGETAKPVTKPATMSLKNSQFELMRLYTLCCQNQELFNKIKTIYQFIAQTTLRVLRRQSLSKNLQLVMAGSNILTIFIVFLSKTIIFC